MNLVQRIELDQSHATISEDAGSGRLLGDPLAILRGGVATWGGHPPSGDSAEAPIHTMPIGESVPRDENFMPPLAPYPHMDDPGLPLAHNPGVGGGSTDTTTSAQAASSFGPSQTVLDAINQAAGRGGANLQLGPQMDFAPATTTTTSGGGASGGIIFIALAIVGVLAYLHFHKKKTTEQPH